jgi:predicted TIM-barrel fold metal-dependent hydrolase
MIIDIHTHFGDTEGRTYMPVSLQLKNMEDNGIDYALISNISCGYEKKEIEYNKKLLDMIRENKDKLGCMLWVCPGITKEEREEFLNMYLENKDIVKGLKVHPDISRKMPHDEDFDYYYEMAEKYSLPVLIHTQDNTHSKISYFVNAAKKFPKVKFIMAHMGNGSDGMEALDALETYENIYADTAWVSFELVKKAIADGYSHKIMFGTDNPIIGSDCYILDDYKPFKEDGTEEMARIMYKNAKEIFNI